MAKLKRELGLFDVVNLVVGTIVGADIYIAASFGAGFLGPASLFAWIIAGTMAIIIALSFAECSSLLPRIGGPYAYSKEVFGDFVGFLAGWSLWIASWSAIAVFPLAFVAYLMYFYPEMSFVEQSLVKIIFILSLTFVNYIGVRAAGRLNDILTILKLSPLFIFAVFGLLYFIVKPSVFISNYSPFIPLGFGSLGDAIVLIFWAYVGFELVTVPSDEVIDAKNTIPKAIVIGMGIVSLFYLITNFVILGVVPWKMLSTTSAPLTYAGYALMGAFGAVLLTIGALFSISGSEEAGILSTARIPYAMAGDGLLPKIFAKIHPRYKTPHIALIFQNTTALVASIIGSITQLIILSVFTLLFCYLITCISVFPLRRKYKKDAKILSPTPAFGILICIYIMSQCAFDAMIVGMILITIGIPIFLKYAPRKEIIKVKKDIISRESVMRRWIRSQEIFLAHFLRRLVDYLKG